MCRCCRRHQGERHLGVVLRIAGCCCPCLCRFLFGSLLCGSHLLAGSYLHAFPCAAVPTWLLQLLPLSLLLVRRRLAGLDLLASPSSLSVVLVVESSCRKKCVLFVVVSAATPLLLPSLSSTTVMLPGVTQLEGEGDANCFSSSVAVGKAAAAVTTDPFVGASRSCDCWCGAFFGFKSRK